MNKWVTEDTLMWWKIFKIAAVVAHTAMWYGTMPGSPTRSLYIQKYLRCAITITIKPTDLQPHETSPHRSTNTLSA